MVAPAKPARPEQRPGQGFSRSPGHQKTPRAKQATTTDATAQITYIGAEVSTAEVRLPPIRGNIACGMMAALGGR